MWVVSNHWTGILEWTTGLTFLWFYTFLRVGLTVTVYLIQNSQAVKKVCGPQKGYGEKRCEIQGGGQEMAVMVGWLMVKILITTIQVNFVPRPSGTKFT